MTTTHTRVAGFRSATVDPHETMQVFTSRAFAGQTLRQVVHLDGGGSAVRILLSNRYGTQPLVIGEARLAARTAGNGIGPSTDAPLLFGGAA
ncbi:hypothetical protein [Streptomyces sp. NPDC000410]|uniref:hypothetical protein n=1 Tax=Streptomyces sp. NPDC000410 TaxID=3154254 RepID=UPI003319897A